MAAEKAAAGVSALAAVNPGDAVRFGSWFAVEAR
jgi:hypothetical protein